MSPVGHALFVAASEDVESFFAVHTPPDHLIRTYLEQEGVVPEVIGHYQHDRATIKEFEGKCFVISLLSNLFILNEEFSCLKDVSAARFSDPFLFSDDNFEFLEQKDLLQ
ncbi:hypothetical protein Tco_0174943 [Tanacetum coccineum]